MAFCYTNFSENPVYKYQNPPAKISLRNLCSSTSRPSPSKKLENPSLLSAGFLETTWPFPDKSNSFGGRGGNSTASNESFLL